MRWDKFYILYAVGQVQGQVLLYLIKICYLFLLLLLVGSKHFCFVVDIFVCLYKLIY